jgi:hypothetical protein
MGVDSTVLDFWRWALGDLRMNTARSVLAEFLVRSAIRDPSPIRREWASFDLKSSRGARVEVKTAAYLQSWAQRALTRPSFSLGKVIGLEWNVELGQYTGDPRALKADVWVFALHTCTDPEAYDPLDAGQWRFWVVPANAPGIQERAQSGRGGQVPLGWVESNASTGPVSLAELGEVVDTSYGSAG